MTFHSEMLTRSFGLHLAPDVVQRSLSLSSTFLLGSCEPLNSVSVLQQSFEDVRFEREELHHNVDPIVTSDNLIATLSERTGIPASTISGTGDQIDFPSALNHVVVGSLKLSRRLRTN